MSGLHRLFREAGRAGAFTRRLERSLEPARQAGSASGEWALLRIDERLAGLVGAADPFSSLETVLSRIAVKPAAADEHQPRIVRHGDATGTRPPGERRQPMRPEVAGPARRRAPLPEQTAAAQPSNVVAPPGHRSASVAAVAPFAALASAAEKSVRLGQRPSAPRAGHRFPAATADPTAVDLQVPRAPGLDPLRPVALPATAVVESRRRRHNQAGGRTFRPGGVTFKPGGGVNVRGSSQVRQQIRIQRIRFQLLRCERLRSHT